MWGSKMGMLDKIRIIQNAKLNEGFKDENIYIRVTKEEKELMQKLAKCQSLNLSNFVRWVILSKYKNDFIRE